MNASNSREISAAFADLGGERPDALFVAGDGLFNARRSQLVNLMSRHALPTGYADRVFPEIGGLISYGTNVIDAYRQVGSSVGRILKGAKPADLPVVQASKFEPSLTPKPLACSDSQYRPRSLPLPTRSLKKGLRCCDCSQPQ